MSDHEPTDELARLRVELEEWRAETQCANPRAAGELLRGYEWDSRGLEVLSACAQAFLDAQRTVAVRTFRDDMDSAERSRVYDELSRAEWALEAALRKLEARRGR